MNYIVMSEAVASKGQEKEIQSNASAYELPQLWGREKEKSVAKPLLENKGHSTMKMNWKLNGRKAMQKV